MLLRKEFPGSDSFGHVWPEAGAVVEVDDEHGRHLLRIQDAGFSEVAPEPVEAIDESPPPVAKTPVKPAARRTPAKGIDVTTFTE